MTTTQNTTDKITTAILAKIANRETSLLIVDHRTMEEMTTREEFHSLISAIIGDEICRRLDINNEMDAIFEDVDNDFIGTYNEAIVLAIAMKSKAF